MLARRDRLPDATRHVLDVVAVVPGALEDLETQEKHGVSYLRYWVDEEAGKIFCLAEGPDAETVSKVHEEAHGLVAQEVFRVSEHT